MNGMFFQQTRRIPWLLPILLASTDGKEVTGMLLTTADWLFLLIKVSVAAVPCSDH
jgi:hypothetical protein